MQHRGGVEQRRRLQHFGWNPSGSQWPHPLARLIRGGRLQQIGIWQRRPLGSLLARLGLTEQDWRR
jgi:hypothetical protein